MHYKDIPLNSLYCKNIVLRLDLNVPIKNGVILSNFKILDSLKTIKLLLKKSNKITILTHLGNPNSRDISLSLTPICKSLEKALGMTIKLIDTIDKNHLFKFDKICVLENTRYFKGEYENCGHLARSLASLGDIYIQDAFACSHRNHASINAITNFLPSYIGPNLKKEITILDTLRQTNNKLAVIGGAKVKTKVELVKNLLKNNFKVFAAGKVGNYIQSNYSEFAHDNLFLPSDGYNENHEYGIWGSYFDIGQSSINILASLLKISDYLVWNGPLGKFEETKFANGTNQFIRLVAQQKNIYSIVGGGETLLAANNLNSFNHICCAGGAFIAYLSDKNLPGIYPLQTSPSYHQH